MAGSCGPSSGFWLPCLSGVWILSAHQSLRLRDQCLSTNQSGVTFPQPLAHRAPRVPGGAALLVPGQEGPEWGPWPGQYPQGAAAAEVGVVGIGPVSAAALTWGQQTEGGQRGQGRDRYPRPPRPQTQPHPGVKMAAGARMAL